MRFVTHPDYVPSLFAHKKASRPGSVDRFARAQKRKSKPFFFPTFGDFLAAVLESRKRLVIFRARHSQKFAKQCTILHPA